MINRCSRKGKIDEGSVLHGPDGPESLRYEEIDDPTPGPGQVIVRLRAAALNHRDVYIARGKYSSGLRFPIVLGSDGVGELAAVGSGVAALAIGHPVVINPSLEWGGGTLAPGPKWRILGLPDNGTFAELIKVPAENVLPRPARLSDEEAAAIPLAGLTAYRAVVTRGRVRADDTVLVLGIGGGVATFALLIARRIGARVLVTSGSDAKLEAARSPSAPMGASIIRPRTGSPVFAKRRAGRGRT